jgi:hypothetical protein
MHIRIIKPRLHYSFECVGSEILLGSMEQEIPSLQQITPTCKTSRVTATGTPADTATAIDTATDSETDNCNCNLGFYEETLNFQTSNFEILMQGLDALS